MHLREIKEELPKLKVGPIRLWKEVKSRNRLSGRKMSDAIFIASEALGRLKKGGYHQCKGHNTLQFRRQVINQVESLIRIKL